MTKDEVISKLKELDLLTDSYVVFGSGPMAVAGIREVNDIDLLVTPELKKQLASSGWQEVKKGPKDIPVVHDVFEAHDSWAFSKYCPSLNELQSRATVVDGIPFAPIEDVLLWKQASGREKDIRDVKLIDKYLNKPI